MSTRSIQHIVAGTIIELTVGDIVQQRVDAVVNAANTSLLPGGGVDGAIHRAAGPELVQETHQLGGCKVGDAKISGGYNLPAKHIIHTVGPIYGITSDAPAMLASAYRRSLEVAQENQLKTLAFPAISTGAYRYPLPEAAEIALQTTQAFLKDRERRGTVELARFVLFDENAYQQFQQALSKLIASSTE